MKSRGIIFRGDMVRAIREGRKTQTRRVVKPQPVGFIDSVPCSRIVRSRDGNVEDSEPIRCPYGVPGDELWVRETWAPEAAWNPDWARETGERPNIVYAADDACRSRAFLVRWRPSIFMPREACRLALVVRSVRVERLSAITHEDAIAEGFQGHDWVASSPYISGPHTDAGELPAEEYVRAFRQMHKLPADADPWLWVVTFGVKP